MNMNKKTDSNFMINEARRLLRDADYFDFDDILIGYYLLLMNITSEDKHLSTGSSSITEIDTCIAKLPPQYSTILRYRYLEHCTLRETARYVGCSSENVRVLENKSIKMLKARTHEFIKKDKVIFNEKKAQTLEAIHTGVSLPNDLSVIILDFTSATYNLLKRKDIHTISQLFALSDEQLLMIEGIGEKKLEEITKKKQWFLATNS